MNWMHDAAKIYDMVMSGTVAERDHPLVPVCHTEVNAHIEVILGLDGKFLDARMVPKRDAVTILPCTEESAAKSGTKPKPHPLVDKLQYLASDFRDKGGEVTSGFRDHVNQPHQNYMEGLSAWCGSSHVHPKAQAVFTYLKSGSLLSDLKTKLTGTVFDTSGKFLQEFPHKKKYALGAPMNSVVRWIVEDVKATDSKLWKDKTIQASWCTYYGSNEQARGICYVTGRTAVPLAVFHPARLRHGGDKAKLISANDKDGFTFRGRFDSEDEACGVGFEFSQKAHSALRWLIASQGRRFGECAYVTWGWSDDIRPVAPQPFDDTDILISLLSNMPPAENGSSSLQRDEAKAGVRNVSLAEIYAQNLSTCLAGYSNKLGDNHRNIHLVAIDSASTGCMSLVLDRQIDASQLLDNLKHWHLSASWIQDFGTVGQGKEKIRRHFIGAPSPESIAWLVCGRNSSKKHESATVNRILPVIIDGAAFPVDIVNTCVARVFHRAGLKHWEWEKALGITCALYRYTHQERNYHMALEYGRKTRDYLWGCLLALAEVTERYSLERQSQESRPTNAERLFARFAEQPFVTWTNIELALQPYLTRLAAGDGLAQWIGRRFKERVDEIMKDGFDCNGLIFKDNSRLSGEFLLGYHCQRRDLYSKGKKSAENQTATPETEEEDHE